MVNLSRYAVFVYGRHVYARVIEALSDTPVVLLTGARQVGKITLAQTAGNATGASYFTLDDAATLASASADPTSFVRNLPQQAIIDEVQRAPELMLAIKASVDTNRRPGRFLLTGSADVLTVPRVADSLAGRMELQRLWPLSQGELEGAKEDFVASLFRDDRPRHSRPLDEDDLRNRLLRGGYPEAVGRPAYDRRAAWFSSYTATIIQRDIRDISNIEGLHDLPRLLQILADRTSTLFNASSLSRETGIAQTTLKRYLVLLESTFLLQFQPAWATNTTKRLTRAPKLLLTDTGLVTATLGIDDARLATDRTLLGRVLETFVVLELYKQLGWSTVRAALFHYRTYSGQEVDVVLETPDGSLAAVEVKATATPTQRDFASLKAFRDDVGQRLTQGVVLYLGDKVLPFGDRLWAVPVGALWTPA